MVVVAAAAAACSLRPEAPPAAAVNKRATRRCISLVIVPHVVRVVALMVCHTDTVLAAPFGDGYHFRDHVQ